MGLIEFKGQTGLKGLVRLDLPPPPAAGPPPQQAKRQCAACGGPCSLEHRYCPSCWHKRKSERRD